MRPKTFELLCGSLSGQFPALPLFLCFLAFANERGIVRGDPDRIRYNTGFSEKDFQQGLDDLSAPQLWPRFQEEANGYIRVEKRDKWLVITLVSYCRYIENNRPQPAQWRELRDSVFRRDGFLCVYCGNGGKVECDHVIPASKGGRHDLDNLVTACKPCNRSKRAKFLADWRPDLVPKLTAMGISTGVFQ